MSAAADWASFAACALAIGYAGARLTRLADAIGEKTGLSGSWIGLVLLATATSLPEMATGVSAVTVANAPNLAIGNALGSTIFNLALLVLVDFLHQPGSLYTRAGHGHILSAAFGIVLLGVVGASLLLERAQVLPAIAHIGAYTPLLLALYLVAMRNVYEFERRQPRPERSPGSALPARYRAITLRAAVFQFVLFGALVAAAGTLLPVLGVRIADTMNWSRSFVGTLFITAVTSLPELVVTITALRLGALDMAIGNLLGSNLFNIVVVIALDDLFFTGGSILANVATAHAVTAFSAAMMSGAVIVGLVSRPGRQWRYMPSMVSLALATVYLVNVYVLYVHGE